MLDKQNEFDISTKPKKKKPRAAHIQHKSPAFKFQWDNRKTTLAQIQVLKFIRLQIWSQFSMQPNSNTEYNNNNKETDTTRKVLSLERYVIRGLQEGGCEKTTFRSWKRWRWRWRESGKWRRRRRRTSKLLDFRDGGKSQRYFALSCNIMHRAELEAV